jgi:putative transposase
MSFQADHFYHIYNRGNNKQKIFFTDANYQFFLNKIQKEILGHCDLVCFCLMPNHYHLFIYFGAHHRNFRHSINMENLERKIGTLQSSYTRAINNQEGRVGSLFQAKFKVVEVAGLQQAINCFKYVHNNPVKAGLVKDLMSWRYSSFNEYYFLQLGKCNREIAHDCLQVPRAGNEILRWMDSSLEQDEGTGKWF